MSTALVFRIVVRGQPYMLRLIMHDDPRDDPARHFARMEAGADAGIAPRVRYASAEDRVLITDFVDARPLPANPAPLIARTLRTLHSLPAFPLPKIGSYFDLMDKLVRRFQAAALFPAGTSDELFQLYGEVARAYPRQTELVSSHNDLRPENILFDGHRVWLVDWEAAFLNDRYVDLAVVANFFVEDDASEDAYLQAYFGEPAGEHRRSRFFLMRQAMHLFYGAFLMSSVAAAGVSLDPDLHAPDFREFHRGLVSREIPLEGAETKLQYAKVHLNEALREMRTPRFREALSVVGS